MALADFTSKELVDELYKRLQGLGLDVSKEEGTDPDVILDTGDLAELTIRFDDAGEITRFTIEEI